MVLGLGMGLLANPAQAVSVINSSNPALSREFGKALISPVTLSKTEFKVGVNMAIGASYDKKTQLKVDELSVNFEDNNMDPDSETLILSQGKVTELDSTRPLPPSLVDGSGARPESYCTLKMNRVRSELLIQNPENRWTLKEGTLLKLNPYTPAPQRSSQFATRIVLNLEVMNSAATPGSAVTTVNAEGLRCEIYILSDQNVEDQIVPELEKVLGSWIKFQVNNSANLPQ